MLLMNFPLFLPLLFFPYDLDGDVGGFRRLHHLNVGEGNHLVAYVVWLGRILTRNVVELLLSFRLHVEVLDEELGILPEHLLYLVPHFLLVSINAANELHLLQLLQLQKSLLFGDGILLQRLPRALRVQLVQILKVFHRLKFLWTKLLTLLVKVWSLHHALNSIWGFFVNRGSPFLNRLPHSLLRLELVFSVQKFSTQISYLLQVVFQGVSVFLMERLHRTVRHETRHGRFVTLFSGQR